jgi:AcrR family transcriptional regulator
MSRDKLLAKCLKYFLKEGVANLSLRPLAAAVGTSARMLVHHFGSKEELIAAVMTQVRDKLQSLLRNVAGAEHHSATAVMLAFWELMTIRENLPYLRLLLEVQVLAIQNRSRYGAYLTSNSSSWLSIVEAAFPPGKDRSAMATLCTAVIDGLLLELLSTGDTRRTRNALNLFVRDHDKTGARSRTSSRLRGARPHAR